MAIGNYPRASNYGQVGYGLSSPLESLYQPPIVSLRAPTTRDKYQVGQIWIEQVPGTPANSTAYILAIIANNSATWKQISN